MARGPGRSGSGHYFTRKKLIQSTGQFMIGAFEFRRPTMACVSEPTLDPVLVWGVANISVPQEG